MLGGVVYQHRKDAEGFARRRAALDDFLPSLHGPNLFDGGRVPKLHPSA
jgi:hypothetical protein